MFAAQPPSEWENTLAAAKKEGIVVVGIPASSELRTAIGEKFKNKFGISIELLSARGPENVTRIITEFNAGVRYYDILVAGGATPLSMVAADAADDFTSYMILPEVKDPKNWWGGHIWEDNVSTKKHVYAFLCYTSETWWYNSSQAEPSEIKSFDDLLNPKWKGRIGLLDPRNPGSGQNTWSFIWKIKGEEFLTKLAQQDLLINQNLRQLADGLAKGKLAFTLGVEPLHLRAVHQSGTAGEAGAAHQRRRSRQQRQRRHHGGEKSASSKRGEDFRQLAAQQRRPGALRQGDDPGNAAARRQHGVAEGIRHPGLQRRDDAWTIIYAWKLIWSRRCKKIRTPAIALATKLLK